MNLRVFRRVGGEHRACTCALFSRKSTCLLKLSMMFSLGASLRPLARNCFQGDLCLLYAQSCCLPVTVDWKFYKYFFFLQVNSSVLNIFCHFLYSDKMICVHRLKFVWYQIVIQKVRRYNAVTLEYHRSKRCTTLNICLICCFLLQDQNFFEWKVKCVWISVNARYLAMYRLIWFKLSLTVFFVTGEFIYFIFNF